MSRFCAHPYKSRYHSPKMSSLGHPAIRKGFSKAVEANRPRVPAPRFRGDCRGAAREEDEMTKDEMTHTPGPWKYYNAWGTDHVMFSRLASPVYTVLQSGQAGVDCMIGNEADARLISVSPRMFALLKRKMDSTCPCEFCTEAREIIKEVEG